MKGKIGQHKQLAMGQKVNKMAGGGMARKETREKPDNTAFQKYGSGFRKVKS